MKKGKYTCVQAKKDMTFLFSKRGRTAAKEFELSSKIASHVRGDSLPHQEKTIKCPHCWDYYAELLLELGEYGYKVCQADTMFFFTGGGQKGAFMNLRLKAAARAVIYMAWVIANTKGRPGSWTEYKIGKPMKKKKGHKNAN